MKQKAFTVIELLITTIITTLVVLFLVIFLTGRSSNHEIKTNRSTSIEILEEGMIGDGFRQRYLMVFRDKTTDRRIFYYNQTMVVLPEKDN